MAEGVSIFSPPKSPAVNTSPAVIERVERPVRSASDISGVQSHEPTSPAQRLYAEQRARTDAMTGYVNPETHAVVRGADGRLSVQARDGGSSAAPDAGGQQQPRPQPGQAVVDGDKLKIGDLELSSTDVQALLQRHALEESRKATVPTDAKGYEIRLPENFTLPDGIEWAFDVGHPVMGPLLARAQEIAHRAGMSQDTFQEMLGLHVAHQIQEQQLFNRARVVELDKLGAMASVRVDAVKTWVHGMIGEAAPALLKVLEQAPMASTIVAFEKLMRAHISQGVSGSPGRGRDGAGAGPEKVSQAEYDSMTYSQKLEYAGRFSNANGGGR
jgi:hypothetical protein